MPEKDNPGKEVEEAPEVDVHINQEHISSEMYFKREKRHQRFSSIYVNILNTILIIAGVSCVGALFDRLGFDQSNIIMVYILGVLITAVITHNRIYSIASSIISVIVFNFLFTEPRYTLMVYSNGAPITFVVMFLVAFITGSLAIRLKKHARQSAQAAFRTSVLLDTNRLLQQTKNREEIITVTAQQLNKLLNRSIVVYLWEKEQLSKPYIFTVSEGLPGECISESEKEVAVWAARNNQHAGPTTQNHPEAKCLYFAIRIGQSVYGVAGIVLGDKPLEAYENSIMLSILGECALSLENEKNAREKEEAALLMQNEQLRANLLRAISHDLRTPLTSISGNASNLLTNGKYFTEDTKEKLYTDIYDDSMWLINLVENLLAVTRLSDGQMKLNISSELIDDVIAEALRHVSRQSIEHQIEVHSNTDILLAKMDSKLIVQVVVNLVDNAIKYTPEGSHIWISTRRQGDFVEVQVADDGYGISDEIKPKVFDMFYTGSNRIADSRRSLGMGLALCKSIITAHGGTISVSDHQPQGAVFTFTLPVGEVILYE